MQFRLKAAGLHLLLSTFVALLGLYVVFGIWHPDPLQTAVGVGGIFSLLVVVDVVLGPLLTLLVASSPQKKTLKFDLSVIVLLQLLAYLYGMYSIAVSRPVYVAFDRLRFDVVQADSVVRPEGAVVLPAFAHNPKFKFQWVAVRPFRDAAEQSQRTFDELQTGISPAMRADYYQPLETAWPEMLAKKHDLSELAKYNPKDRVEALLGQYPQADGYLALKAPVQDMTVLLDSRQKAILGIVDLRPWE